MKKPKANQPKKIQNKRARHDYDLGDDLIVGIELNGRETKLLRMGKGQLTGAYVTVKDNEIWLLNATIHGTNGIQLSESEQVRSRKLLAKRRQIDNLIEGKKHGRSILPLEILTGGRFIKVRIAAGRGKKKYDKRQALKARDQKQDINRTIKSFNG